jgi:2Fe-2S ferredoxin
MTMITFHVQRPSGDRIKIEVPAGINLSLMEVLRASGYPIEATCGGMALCATCCVELVDGVEALDAPADTELDLLDTLPVVNSGTRLSCQIRVSDKLQNAVLKVKADAPES